MHRRFQGLLPFTPLLLLPLLLWKFFDADQQSLTAWDEGLYMWRAHLFLDQHEAWVPFAQAHHKTPGHYWLVALSMRLFGVSDIMARLPFILLALLSAWLVYKIGSLIVSRRAGAMASLILGTSYLWAVHSRTISPDLAYISCFLTGLLLLVQEFSKPLDSSRRCNPWRLYGAGLLFALTIFLRSVLAVLPLLGLLPWLLRQARGRRVLTSPWLWFGLGCGCLPTVIWLGKSLAAYGITGFMAPLMFPVGKATETGLPLSGFPFYLAAIFVGFMPWSPLLPFALTSSSLWGDQPRQDCGVATIHRRWLLLAAPATMLLLLAFTSSQHDQYALPIYPFAALLIAADLEHRLAEVHTAKRLRGRGDGKGWRSLKFIVAVYCLLAAIVLAFCFADRSLGLLSIESLATTLDVARLRLLLILLSSVWLLGGVLLWWRRSPQQSLKPWLRLQLFGTLAGDFSNHPPGVCGQFLSPGKGIPPAALPPRHFVNHACRSGEHEWSYHCSFAKKL